MDKIIIAEIYKELTGKTAKQTSCGQCWEDYVIEIKLNMAQRKKAGENTARIESKVAKATGGNVGKTAFSGKRGFELYPFYQIMVAGKIYNSQTLTEKAAKDYLRAGGNVKFFKNIPDQHPVEKEVDPVPSEIID